MHVTFWEKLGCGLLVCGWVLWGGMMLANTLVHPNTKGVDKLMFAQAEKKEDASKPKAPEIADVKVVLAKANPDNGAKTFKAKCVSCHAAEKGAKNKVGPGLWNVVGQAPGAHEGFKYSDAMGKIGKPWDYQMLYDFLRDPRKFAPGTKMTFAGIADAQERADLIAYLRAQSDSPKPLP